MPIALGGDSTLAGPQATAAHVGSPRHIPTDIRHTGGRRGAAAGPPGVGPCSRTGCAQWDTPALPGRDDHGANTANPDLIKRPMQHELGRDRPVRVVVTTVQRRAAKDLRPDYSDPLVACLGVKQAPEALWRPQGGCGQRYSIISVTRPDCRSMPSKSGRARNVGIRRAPRHSVSADHGRKGRRADAHLNSSPLACPTTSCD